MIATAVRHPKTNALGHYALNLDRAQPSAQLCRFLLGRMKTELT